MTKPQRVICPVCGYSWAANKQGVMLTHHLWMGPTKGKCPGSHKTVDQAKLIDAPRAVTVDE